MIRSLARLILIVGPLAFVAALSGCQGLVGAGGQVTGFTVPPGCKGSYTFSWPMPQGSIMGSCDETGETAASPVSPKAMMTPAGTTTPSVAPQGAHITIDRTL